MSKWLTILMAMIVGVASAQKEVNHLLKGNELYKKEEYEKAAEQYRQATEINKDNPKAQLNLGNALYKAKNYEAATKAFDAAAEASKDKTLQSKSHYNKGVSYTRSNKLVESINAYKQSLRLNPNDQQARENLQKALNELKQQQQQQNQQNQDKQDQQKKQEQQRNNSKLNEKQAERMLDALRQEEKRLLQNQQKKQKGGGIQEKDW